MKKSQKKNNKRTNNKQNKNIKNKDKHKRELFILKIVGTFLKFAPILFLGYLYIVSLSTGQQMFQPVIENPDMTISFIVIMLGPFSGICCDFVLRSFSENKNILLSEIILGIIALSQMMAFNIIPAIFIVYVIYKLYDGETFDLNVIKVQLKDKNGIISLLISIFILFISIACSYVRMKI